MNNNQDEDLKAIIRSVLHHVIVMVMVLIMVSAIGFAYMSMKNTKANIIEKPQSSTNNNGKAHPLPEFIVDKIKPDELEQLKP